MFFNRKSKGILLSVTLLLWATEGLSKDIQKMRIWDTAENTRIVFDLSGEVKYYVFTLDHPLRVVLDIQNTQLKSKLLTSYGKDSGIKTIRHSQYKPQTLRIVFELEEPRNPKTFLLTPDKHAPHRLVIDLGKVTTKQKQKTEPIFEKTSKNLKTRAFIIAIDAGHGGDDAGAVSRKKQLREKDIVLAVAERLQNLINAQSGMRAYLVRNGDYYISLRKRMELARAEGADLFISIHADSFNDPRASGASVFVLSEKGASNEAARWLAERENRADWVGGIRLEDKTDILATVLLDLSQTASQTASDELASHLINQLGKITDLHHETVQRAGFMVLKSPDIPSVLVELGFLSNPQGERQLADKRHQQELAKALFTGINTYLAKKPAPIVSPQNTNMAGGKRFENRRG